MNSQPAHKPPVEPAAPRPPDPPLSVDDRAECTRLLRTFIHALGSVSDPAVTAEDLHAALESLRQRQGFAVDIGRADHLGALIEHMVERHLGVRPGA